MVHGSAKSEVPVDPRRRWHRSLWVRIPLIVLLMWGVVGVVCWSRSRSAWAVFRVNGMADSTIDDGIWNLGKTPLGQMSFPDYFHRLLIQDRYVTSVWLMNTGVDDQWLWRLRRFPLLGSATLDGGQVGPGLQQLAELPDLKSIYVGGSQMTIVKGWIDHIDSTISGRHFLMIPQLESLSLGGFRGRITEMDQLKVHPRLHRLVLSEVSGTTDVLQQIEGCRNITSLSVHRKDGLDEAALSSLGRMSHLKTLSLPAKMKSEEWQSRLNDLLPNSSITWP